MSTKKKSLVSGWVEYRVNNKKFSKMFMVLHPENLKLFTSQDSTKEKLIINFDQSVFNRTISNQSKFSSEKLPFSFEIVRDKVHQFCVSDKTQYYYWVNSIPLSCSFVGVFGYPLIPVTSKKKSGWRLPLPIYRSIEYLKNHDGINFEGIFRVSASYTWMNRVKELLDSGRDIADDEFGPEGIQVASCVVKLFIRELSDGLIPSSFYAQYLQAGKTSTTSTRVKILKRLVSDLPDIHRNVLWYVMDYLTDVLKHSKVNNMTTENLAVCFAPTVFGVGADENATDEMKNGPLLRVVFETFLEHFDSIFHGAAVENKKMGLQPPVYPAVIPIHTVSNAVVADMVAKEANKRDGFRRRATVAFREVLKKDTSRVLVVKHEKKSSLDSHGSTDHFTSESFESPVVSPRDGRHSNVSIESKVGESTCNSVMSGTTASVNSSGRVDDVNNSNDNEKISELTGVVNDLLERIEKQNTIVANLLHRVEVLEHGSSYQSDFSTIKVDFLSLRKSIGSKTNTDSTKQQIPPSTPSHIGEDNAVNTTRTNQPGNISETNLDATKQTNLPTQTSTNDSFSPPSLPPPRRTLGRRPLFDGGSSSSGYNSSK
ncbi:Rho GTPase activating protein [Entamoeba marina]